MRVGIEPVTANRGDREHAPDALRLACVDYDDLGGISHGLAPDSRVRAGKAFSAVLQQRDHETSSSLLPRGHRRLGTEGRLWTLRGDEGPARGAFITGAISPPTHASEKS